MELLGTIILVVLAFFFLSIIVGSYFTVQQQTRAVVVEQVLAPRVGTDQGVPVDQRGTLPEPALGAAGG